MDYNKPTRKPRCPWDYYAARIDECHRKKDYMRAHRLQEILRRLEAIRPFRSYDKDGKVANEGFLKKSPLKKGLDMIKRLFKRNS